MSNQPRNLHRFREREVVRITKAVRVAGGGKVILDPQTGRYEILVAANEVAPLPDAATNPWDAVHAADKDRAS
jgi:hypothetical protein